mmetsp:Transcript_106939/g.190104  ORF Transcript_106939/g.190104 Transcript_106939/m.190104 type:complete len:206 (+) Transcript_106939:1222-1839(+)
MTSSRASRNFDNTPSLSVSWSFSLLYAFRTFSALSSSLACSSLSFFKAFSVPLCSSRAAFALASAFLEFFTMVSASSKAFLTLRRMSSHFFVHSSTFALACFSSSPPMFMIWSCSSRTSSSTAWCSCMMLFSSSDRLAMSFSSCLILDFSSALSCGTFSDFSLASYASVCFFNAVTSMVHFCSFNSQSAISFCVKESASSNCWRS